MNMGIILGSTPRLSASPPIASIHAPRRIPNEYYPTPPEATRALLSVEEIGDAIARMARVATEAKARADSAAKGQKLGPTFRNDGPTKH